MHSTDDYLVTGLQAHSLALLSDAGHNCTDALALLLAWFGVYLESKPADETKTFGYHRRRENGAETRGKG